MPAAGRDALLDHALPSLRVTSAAMAFMGREVGGSTTSSPMTLSEVVGVCLTLVAAVAIAVAISVVTGWAVQDILIFPFAIGVALYLLFVGGSLALGLAAIASPLVAVYFGV